MQDNDRYIAGEKYSLVSHTTLLHMKLLIDECMLGQKMQQALQ
jgi:hypothetical protein